VVCSKLVLKTLFGESMVFDRHDFPALFMRTSIFETDLLMMFAVFRMDLNGAKSSGTKWTSVEELMDFLPSMTGVTLDSVRPRRGIL
jgi:TATA-box binding protein (TBP) (component of TFIID and TFIIIB)